jgi:hypothetical protein
MGDNITMDLQEAECGGMDLIDPTQNRDRWWVLVNLSCSVKCGESLN